METPEPEIVDDLDVESTRYCKRARKRVAIICTQYDGSLASML